MIDHGSCPWASPFPPTPPNKRPVAVIDVDKPEVILDINEIATFDGSGSHDPEKSPLTYAWSLVSVPGRRFADICPGRADRGPDPRPRHRGHLPGGPGGQRRHPRQRHGHGFGDRQVLPGAAPGRRPLQRLENNFIFYKEYVNRLTWTANPENKATIAAIKIYRKAEGRRRLQLHPAGLAGPHGYRL